MAATIFRPNRYVEELDHLCKFLGNTYRSIAIVDRNSLTKRITQEIKECGIRYDLYGMDDIAFCQNQYEYQLKEARKDYDIIITGGFDTIAWTISDKEKKIYHLNFLNRGVTSWVGAIEGAISNQDLDIINNVLPELVEKGVHVVILESALQWSGVERIAYEDLAKNGIEAPLEQIFGISCPWLKVRYDFEKGYALPQDSNHAHFNIENGIRRTIGNTGHEKKIYFVGGCQYYGAFVKDEDTIESYLQELVKDQYDVQNYSALRYMQPWRLRAPEYKAGDIVILEVFHRELYERHGYTVYDTLESFEEFNDVWSEVSWDIYAHCNGTVNRRVAEGIYNLCKNKNLL